jgi:NodT family efflux transporter outer membrane factor (OMF) lipoprotein
MNSGSPQHCSRSVFGAPLATAALAGLLVAGCAVGPDFKRPAAPAVTAYTAQPLTPVTATPGVTGGEAQSIAEGADLPGDWWALFHSEPLDALIREALANNHDLKAAQAALRAAHEASLAQHGAFYPQVSAGFAATRQKQSGDIAPTPITNAFEYSLFTPQVAVSYVPDVFGLNRRSLESAKAQEQAVRYQMVATDLTLTSNVANTAIQLAAIREQVQANRELIVIQTRSVGILREQVAKGYAGAADLAAQDGQLQQTIATLPGLEKQLIQQQNLLAVLVGRFPSQAPAEDFTLASLKLPGELPLSLPSTLVQQRPDVLQAEANLHSASAQIGVAIANRLPNFELSANAGNSALTVGQAFNPTTAFWTIGAAITAPIFDGGALKHQEAAAKANYVQAAEQYRSTVLTAFQNVADTLTAIEQDARALKATAAAQAAAQVTLDVSQRQLRAGYAGDLTVLNAQQAYLQARISLVQAEAGRYADTVALFQALGGGWQNRADLSQDIAKDAPKDAHDH